MPRRKLTPPPEEILSDLEAHLAGTLKPVAPPMDFSQRLRARIHMPQPRLLAERIASWRFFFVVVGGVISGALLMITVARALFHLTGRRNLG
jgi:hypothetical protein